MFHIIMLTVENLQVCMLLLGCEKYSLGLLTFKSLKSITYLLTPWSRVLLEKLTGFQLVNKFPAFMEPEGSLPHPQVPATCPYPEPDRSRPYPQTQIPEDLS